MAATEFLLRVRPLPDGNGFSATCRQFAGSAHPEVRAVIGPVSSGLGANALAAMVASLMNSKLQDLTETVAE